MLQLAISLFDSSGNVNSEFYCQLCLTTVHVVQYIIHCSVGWLETGRTPHNIVISNALKRFRVKLPVCFFEM